MPNPKYKANKKNGGNIPAIPDKRVQLVPIGCGQCIECRKQKSREWKVRLSEDIKTNKNAVFVTLTFNTQSIRKLMYKIYLKCETYKPKGYDLDNAIAKQAVRYFLERWRKKYKKSVRHWLVTEIGHNGTENIHLHGLIWTNEINSIKTLWQYGYVWDGYNKAGQKINYVNQKTINYITKYVTKIDQHHPGYKSIILCSPGIGNAYTKNQKGNWTNNKFNGNNTNETYRTESGHKLSIPIYYRNKIYTEEQREQLWLQKLDKQERWVMGQKISIKNGEEEYKQALKYAQQKQNELGQPSPKKWKIQDYDRQRRILQQQERLTKQNK